MVVIVTQLLTAIGAGGWFPYAAPSLWMGIGGVEAAVHVSALQLILALAVAAVAVAATILWWEDAEAR